MSNQNLRALAANSPARRQLYAAVASQFMSWRGECNPFAGMGSPVDFEKVRGRNEGSFAETPISVGMITDADTVTMYHDIKDRLAFVVNDTAGEKDAQEAKRVSLTLGSGDVKQADGFPIAEGWEDAKKAVTSVVNMGKRLGRFANTTQGEMIMAALCGMRGVEKVLGAFPEYLDAEDATVAQMIDGPFMKLINALQGEEGSVPEERKVRALTNCFSTAALSSQPSALTDAMIAAFTHGDLSANRLQYKDFLKLRTYINQSGNLERSDFAFHKAKLNALYAEGGKRKMLSDNETMFFMTSHEVVEDLQRDEEWVEAMNALATHDGNTTGLFTGRSAMMRGTEVAGFDKVPIVRKGSTTAARIALSLMLGRGALCLLQGQTNRKMAFQNWRNVTARRFAETNLPCEVHVYSKADTRNTIAMASIHYRFGVVRPSFPNSEGVRKDYGAVGLLSQLPASNQE